jgi:hypothetical protein
MSAPERTTPRANLVDRTKEVLGALRACEDDLRSLPTELAAVGALLRFAALSGQGLHVNECRGLHELVEHIEDQARRSVAAYEASFDAAKAPIGGAP